MFRKPVAINDWGAEHVRHSAVGPEIEPGEHRVRWPDGTVEVLTVTLAPHHARVGDGGGGYGVNTRRHMLQVPYHGATIAIPLKDVDAEVWDPHAG